MPARPFDFSATRWTPTVHTRISGGSHLQLPSCRRHHHAGSHSHRCQFLQDERDNDACEGGAFWGLERCWATAVEKCGGGACTICKSNRRIIFQRVCDHIHCRLARLSKSTWTQSLPTRRRCNSWRSEVAAMNRSSWMGRACN